MDNEEFLKRYTTHLNENQLRAVHTVDGPVLLLAVPGSGKTTVLVTRLGYMIYCRKIDPAKILTLTYTVSATHDMKVRFEKIFGKEYSESLEFRTINGICYKMIQQYARMTGRGEDSIFRLITDEKEGARIIADILVDLMDEYPTESDIKAVRALITYCKNMMLSDDEIQSLGKREGIKLLEIYQAYNSYLKTNSLMDYDDQMVYAYRMLKSSKDLLKIYQDRYRYICVDEAQDTSKIQHMIIGLLAGTDGNLFMVGDEDQSIYGFRAAYPEALLNFEKEHPSATVLVMDQNYRSNANIVSAANLFIQHNKERHEKNMRSTKGVGSDINYVELNARSNQYGYLIKVAEGCERETAVLYRDNESAVPLIDILDRRRISFRIKSVDMSFFTSRVVTDITNIMKFALDPYDTDLFMRVYFKCQTYLKKSQAESMCRISSHKKIPVLKAAEYVDSINGMVKGKCRAFATNIRNMLDETPGKALFRIENPLGYREYLERNSIDQNKLFTLRMLSFNESTIEDYLKRLEYLQRMLKTMKPDYNSRFILSTIHSSKGLEYDRVYLMDVFDGMFPVDFIKPGDSFTPQDMKMLEEERRLLYVGMTRAKNDLVIFTFKSEKSSFIKEMRTQVRHKIGNPEQTKSKGGFKKRLIASSKSENEEISNPLPATQLPEPPQREVKKKKTNGKDTYVSWTERFPEHVIIKKEGAFWTTRGKSAQVLNQILGYKLGGKPGAYMTGSPAVDPIVKGLNENRISFIVVESGKIIDQSDFD